jgi:hypothetical protein
MHYTAEQQQDAGDSRALRIVGIICGIILGLLLLAYVIGCIYFAYHLWPNTTARGIDLSLMTTSEARSTLEESAANTTVHVTGDGVDFVLDSSNTGIELNSDEAVQAMRKNVIIWAWPIMVLTEHDESTALAATYNEDEIRASVEEAVSAFNAQATDPVDASVIYSEEAQAFVIDPGSAGTKIDFDTVTQLVLEALINNETLVTLTSSALVQQGRTADDSTLLAALETANKYLSCNINYTLNGTVIATEDASVVKDWISVDSDCNVIVDEEAMNAWADDLEDRLDTVGETVTYTRPDGKVITVSGGTYGWIVDGDILHAMVSDTVYNSYSGDQELPMKQTAETYNPGGQSWGARYIDVDITEQHMRFYDESGTLILESDIITGSTIEGGRETPTGVYYITNKATNVTLIGLPDENGNPLYTTPVTYWMPFIDNTVGLHDATWQSSFGGNLYQEGYGSHGCVNLPYDVAETLYSLVNVGDVVITHY